MLQQEGGSALRSGWEPLMTASLTACMGQKHWILDNRTMQEKGFTRGATKDLLKDLLL